MDELRLGPAQASRLTADANAWLRGWQVGQLLRAQVVDSAANGGALLRISGRQVSAATDIFLPKGAWLNLRVTGLEPTPTVRILETPIHSRELPTPLERQTLALLPRQGSVFAPLQALLDPARRVNLLSLLGLAGGDIDPAFDAVVLPGLPRSPEALGRALSRAGLFYESGLALRGAQGTSVDLKALLFRLLARIERARGESQAAGAAAHAQLAVLSRDVEGALATIALNQLAASQYVLQDAIYWVFHVPFRMQGKLHGLSVTLASDDKGAGEDEEPREWRALLALDLPRLGELEAELFLRGNRVSAVIYSERPATLRRLDATLADLRTVLARAGFEVGVLRLHEGRRRDAEPGQPTHAGLRSRV